MKPINYQAYSLATLVLLIFTNLSPATAAENTTLVSEQGRIEMTADEANYQSTRQEVLETMAELEKLGGGMKPLRNYLKQIDDSFNKGNHSAALKQLSSLHKSVAQQLKKVSELRSRKPVANKKAAPIPVAPGLPQALPNQEPVNVLINAFNKAQSSNPSKVAGFNGSANDYLRMVVKDIVAKELGSIALPCKGPFRLERFRIAQRISELQKQGTDVRNYLAYYKRTEAVAHAAKRNSGRIAELSSNVRYLSQQLGLKPLSGSINTRALRRR